MKSIIVVLVIIVITAVLSLLYIFHTAFQTRFRDPIYAMNSADTSNFEAIEYGLIKYLEDHDGKLPVIDKPWGLREILYPQYISRETVFLCPHRVKSTSSTDPRISGYHFNVKVSGQPVSSLEDGTIIIYEPWGEEEHPPRYRYIFSKGVAIIFYISSNSMHPDELVIFDEDYRKLLESIK